MNETSRPVPDGSEKLARIRKLAEAIMFDSDAEPVRAAILAVLDEPAPTAPVPVTGGVDLEGAVDVVMVDDLSVNWIATFSNRGYAEGYIKWSTEYAAKFGVYAEEGESMEIRPARSRLSPPTREALALAIARTMPGWNDDTTEPDITDAKLRTASEAHWESVNAECLRQGGEYADAVLAFLSSPETEGEKN